MRKSEFRLFGLKIFENRITDTSEQRSTDSGVSTLENPAEWLRNALGGVGITGEYISEEKAMQIPAFAGCVKILSETVAMLPFKPMITDKDGNTTTDRNHPSYQLLQVRPNPLMNAYIWKETMQCHAALYGNGYSLIIRDSDNKPVELRLINNPKEVKAFQFENNLFFKVKGVENLVRGDDMFHIAGLTYNGINGVSPVKILSNVLSLSYAVEKYGSMIFSKGGSKRVAFEHPGKLDKTVKENIKESFMEKYGDTDNVHEPAFLEAGLKLVEIGMNPGEAQMIELKRWLIQEICRPFRVQLHLIQHMEQSTNNNIEKQSREFIDYTMMPWLVKWEKEADLKLFANSERGNHFTKFNVKGLLRGDFKNQTEGLVKLIQWAVYTPNDALRILDENTYEGGDVHLFPQNMTTAEKMNEENQ